MIEPSCSRSFGEPASQHPAIGAEPAKRSVKAIAAALDDEIRAHQTHQSRWNQRRIAQTTAQMSQLSLSGLIKTRSDDTARAPLPDKAQSETPRGGDDQRPCTSSSSSEAYEETSSLEDLSVSEEPDNVVVLRRRDGAPLDAEDIRRFSCRQPNKGVAFSSLLNALAPGDMKASFEGAARAMEASQGKAAMRNLLIGLNVNASDIGLRDAQIKQLLQVFQKFPSDQELASLIADTCQAADPVNSKSWKNLELVDTLICKATTHKLEREVTDAGFRALCAHSLSVACLDLIKDCVASSLREETEEQAAQSLRLAAELKREFDLPCLLEKHNFSRCDTTHKTISPQLREAATNRLGWFTGNRMELERNLLQNEQCYRMLETLMQGRWEAELKQLRTVSATHAEQMLGYAKVRDSVTAYMDGLRRDSGVINVLRSNMQRLMRKPWAI